MYCAVLYEVMPHAYLIMHKQTIKGVLTGMHAGTAVLLSRCIYCNVNCARMMLFLLKWCTSGSNTNIAVDVCDISDNISEIVQKVVE